MLPGPGRDVKALALEARSMVFDVCFSPVAKRLDTVPSLSSWAREEGGQDQEQGWGVEDGYEYDTVPQPYMTQVGRLGKEQGGGRGLWGTKQFGFEYAN